MKRVGVVFLLILAFFGVANSVYIAQHEKSGTSVLCGSNNLSDCIVAANSYLYSFGLSPVEYSVLFYSIIFILAALELVIFSRLLRRVLQMISFVGVLAALYLTLVQVFIIDVFCIYCVISALIAFCMFIFASLIEPIRKNSQKKLLESPATEVPKEGGLSMPPTA